MTEMARQRFLDEPIKQVSDHVSRNRVHADNDQRESPQATVPYFHDQIKCGEKEETPAAAEEHPTRGPDSFHDRANAGHTKQPTCGKANNASHRKPPDLG